MRRRQAQQNADKPVCARSGPAVISLTLPYPPSVNHYWSYARGSVRVSDEGRAYRGLVAAAIASRRYTALRGRLAVTIEAYAPDFRLRDVDNLGKATLDSITHAGLWLDDSQIDDLRIIRKRPEPPGAIVVHIEEMQT
jgi:crossover junction endodeoxyribonuclease RusA